MRMAFQQEQGDWLSNLIGQDLIVNGWQVDLPHAANDDQTDEIEPNLQWLTFENLKVRS